MNYITLYRSLAIALLVSMLLSCPVFAADNDDDGGIKLGALTIYPTLLAALRYNDNIYFVPEDELDRIALFTKDKESDFIVNVQPDILFDVSTTSFNFQFGYNFYGDIYTGFDDEEEEHDDLNASNHSLRTALSYQAPVGFFIKLKDQFILQETFTTSGEYVDYLKGDQKHNDGTLTIGYKRQPEDTVYFGLSYRNVLDVYDEEDFDYYNRMAHWANMELRLKFFPRTALVVDGTGGLIRNQETEDLNVLVYGGVAGLIGQVTSFMQIKALGGFTVWDYSANDDYRNYLATGEIAFVWSPPGRIALGYDHRVMDATDTNFRVTDELYLHFRQAIAHRVAMELRGSYMFNEFSRPNKREERFLQAHADITTRILYWFYIGVEYNFERKLTEPGEDSETLIMRHIGMLKFIAKF